MVWFQQGMEWVRNSGPATTDAPDCAAVVHNSQLRGNRQSEQYNETEVWRVQGLTSAPLGRGGSLLLEPSLL